MVSKGFTSSLARKKEIINSITAITDSATSILLSILSIFSSTSRVEKVTSNTPITCLFSFVSDKPISI